MSTMSPDYPDERVPRIAALALVYAWKGGVYHVEPSEGALYWFYRGYDEYGSRTGPDWWKKWDL
jgi:hypothetical protein